jgi:glycosyltransferase involved in cell wall biosynthesis
MSAVPAGGAPDVHVVLPGDVDDPRVPSGGNAYDRRVCRGLGATGWRVREIPVPGAWPRPATRARAALARSLAALPDGAVVLVDGLVACGIPEVVVPEAGRLRVAVLVHLPLADESGLAPVAAGELDRRERATLRAVSSVVATSDWAARRLVERHGLPTSRVHVVTPGADPAPLAGGTDGASGLLCVASITPRKGHDLLVEALAEVAEETWSCTCVGPLTSDPEHVARLRRLIDRRGLAGRVRLTGPRTGGSLAATYAAADLMVLPSRAETYGMVVTEALARGLPVLARAVGGVPDALGRAPGGDLPGLLVPPGDPAALAGALRRWLGSPEVRRRLRTAARDRRATLDPWTRTSARMADVLAALRPAPR